MITFLRNPLLVLIGFTLSLLAGQPGAEFTSKPTPPAAEIREIYGRVEYRLNPQAGWEPAWPGQTLAPGSQVRTINEAQAAIRFTGGMILRLAPDSLLTVHESNDAPDHLLARLELALSEIFGLLIDEPGGAASVRG